MPRRFEYRVCQEQYSRVTFVNGAWQGSARLDPDDVQRSVQSCPNVWDYLDAAGRDGWELVSALNQAHGGDNLIVLYLLREGS